MSQFDSAIAGVAVGENAPVGIGTLAWDSARPVTWSRSTTLAAAGSLIILAAIAISAWIATDAVVPWDSKNHFYAMYRFLGDALARGETPFWNPFHFGGYPAIADPQSLIFTPTMLFFAWIAPEASMQAFDAMVFSHLLLGGLAILALFRRRNWHPAGAVLAGAIFMLGGPAASRLQHTGMIISYGFIPVAWWLLEVALARKSMRHGVAFAALAALMAVGRDQVAFMACAMLIAAALAIVATSDRPLTFLHSRLPTFLVMAITGLALLAIPTILTMQFLGASNRPGIAYGVAAAGSLAPINFITMLAPNVFGSLNWTYDYWGPGYETISDPDWTDRAVNYLFIGTVPAVLLLWHGLAGGRLFGRQIRFHVVAMTLATLYAIGRYTPAFSWFFDLFPGVALYRRPADATFILNILFAITSGYLLHLYILRGLPRIPRRSVPVLGAALAALACVLIAVGVAGAAKFSADFGHLGAAVTQLAIGGALFALAVVAMIVPKGEGLRAVVATALVVATGGELVLRNAASSLNAEPASRYAVYSGLSKDNAEGLDVLRRELSARAEQGERPRVEILGLTGAWQNASMVLGLENTLGYNPLRIDDYERMVGPGENAVDPNLRHFPGTFRGYKCVLATLLGLEYLILDRPVEKLPRHVPRPHATQIFAGDHMFIYRLGAVAPRAYLATSVKPVEGEEILDSHVLPDFDRTREALIDKASIGELGGRYDAASDAGTDSNVKIAAYHDDRVVIEVDAEKAGVLVLHDIYYPGWEATVDGVRQPVLRANVLFRGVEVPSGHHVVAFSYHPLSLANLTAAASGLLHGAED